MSGLLRSNLVVAVGTLLSRITGLLRFVALATVLGGTAVSDAYILANESPNIIYELLVGGVLSATLVPLFTSFDVDDDDESRNVVITTAISLILIVTIVAVAAAPLIFGLFSRRIADGVDADGSLAREHDGTRPVKYRVGNVGRLGSGRSRGIHHALEHLCCRDDGATKGYATTNEHRP